MALTEKTAFPHSPLPPSALPEDPARLRYELDRSVKEMGQFAYIVSHDLQAPLRMVTGFLELLVKRYGDQLDEQARKYIGYAVSGSEKMSRLIFDLLTYSRLSTVQEEFVTVDLRELIGQLREKILYQEGSHRIRISTGPLPAVRGCRAQLQELFMQLMNNAVKFRSAEDPEVDIYSEQANGYWQISIQDNGIGIDPIFHEKIFQVFRRLHADEEKYKGTGIGLALCRKICELHGGWIGVEPAPVKGSIFRVYLPVSSINR